MKRTKKPTPRKRAEVSFIAPPEEMVPVEKLETTAENVNFLLNAGRMIEAHAMNKRLEKKLGLA